jgi:hypothetical protein
MKMKSKGWGGALFAVLLMAAAQVASAADVTGTWNMSVETTAGTGSPVFTLTQKGDTISGTYKGQLGEAPVTGTVKGDDVTLEIKVEVQGQSLTVVYTGKLDGKNMSGKVSLGQLGDGTFKGTKQ